MSKGNEKPETIEFWKWLNKSGIADDFVYAVVKCLKDIEHIPPKKVLSHVYSQLNGGKTIAQTIRAAAILQQDLEQEYESVKRKNDSLYKRLEAYEPDARNRVDSTQEKEDLSSDSENSDADVIENDPLKNTRGNVDPKRGPESGILKGSNSQSRKSLGQVRFDKPNVDAP